MVSISPTKRPTLTGLKIGFIFLLPPGNTAYHQRQTQPKGKSPANGTSQEHG